MVHKPKHKVHSFRGLLGDGGEDEINLERQNVNVAYRLIKFAIIPSAPGTVSSEHVVKVYREEQNSIDGLIDFTAVDLLGAAYYNANVSGGDVDYAPPVIFDNDLFSRNIYVTHSDVQGAGSINYYIEIEEVPVTASTLMQMKLGVARKLNLQQD